MATIDQTSCSFDGTYLTVAADGSETCDYSVSLVDVTALADAPTLNTATITLNDIDFSATDLIEYTPNVIRGSATLSDDEIGLSDDSVSGGDQFTGSDSITCSTDAGDYDGSGSYGDTITNIATLVDSQTNEYTDDATTVWVCEAGFMDLLKLTDGQVDPTTEWTFELYEGGFGGTLIGASSTLNDADGVLHFGDPALRPDTTYTVCELDIPAGWTTVWEVDVDGDGVYDQSVTPYNPDDGEDLGNRCVDFGNGLTVTPLTVGTTIHFRVDNQSPGGAPRTPGYWKNWNRCTNGGQAAAADRNGGWEEGFWLLEDVLRDSYDGAFVWDDILEDDLIFEIDNCEDAVLILDKRDLDGKKKAKDPLHSLATNLLAAQLNFGAGACTTPEVLDAAYQAEMLLDEYDFDGYGYEGPKLHRRGDGGNLATDLAEYLDRYNNGEFCGGSTEKQPAFVFRKQSPGARLSTGLQFFYFNQVRRLVKLESQNQKTALDDFRIVNLGVEYPYRNQEASTYEDDPPKYNHQHFVVFVFYPDDPDNLIHARFLYPPHKNSF